jgi:putative DNA primase/helicase
MPKDICEMLSDRGMWRTVRPLTGIVEAPMFLGDGSIMQSPGYDRKTGYVYAPSVDFPQVPEHPTTAQIEEAASLLCEPWSEFSWRSPADSAVMVALLLSILCRPAIGDVPAFALDATTPGSGKGLALDVASVIATGRKANKQTYAYDPIEQEKILGAMAMRGAALIAFDDIKEPFGGSPLCKVLTCGGANSFRVLGRSEAPDLPWHAIITVTGNNISLMGDIPRRVVMARLEPSVEHPELETNFAHPRLLDWVVENRPRLVVAALTIARGWWLAGKPHMGLKTLGSFEAWAELVPRICVFSGLANPMDCCPSNQNIEDPETTALRCIVKGWPVLAPNGDTVKNIVERLWPNDMKGAHIVDAHEDMRNALCVLGPPRRDGGVPDSREIGKSFSKLRGRIVSGMKLVCKSVHGGILHWNAVDIQNPQPGCKKSNGNGQLNNGLVGSVGSVGWFQARVVGKQGDENYTMCDNLDDNDERTGVESNQPTQPTQPTSANPAPPIEPIPADEPGLFGHECSGCGQYSSFCFCSGGFSPKENHGPGRIES